MAENDILEKLEQIHREIQELAEWKAGQEQICQSHRSETDDLKRALFGNGQPGLVTRVQEVEFGRKSEDPWKAAFRQVVTTALTAAVIGAAVVLMRRV